jgi:hypothetical protein
MRHRGNTVSVGFARQVRSSKPCNAAGERSVAEQDFSDERIVILVLVIRNLQTMIRSRG